MVYYPPMKQLARQIPHGGDTEGCIPFRMAFHPELRDNCENRLFLGGGGANNSLFASCASLTHPNYIFNSVTLTRTGERTCSGFCQLWIGMSPSSYPYNIIRA
jgi:hypothetical protein